MITDKVKKRIKELTMACWWPEKAFPNRTINWPAIYNELAHLYNEGQYREAPEGLNEYKSLMIKVMSQGGIRG